MLEKFGTLPEDGQVYLIERLIAARLSYDLQVTIDPPKNMRNQTELRGFPTHAQERRRLVDIQKSSIRLLKLLGIDDPASVAVGPFEKGMGILHSVATTWHLTSLPRVATESRGARATLGAIERLGALLLLLSDLVAAAGQSAEQVNRQIVEKANRSVKAKGAVFPRTGQAARGGPRRQGETADSRLVRNLIETYLAVRDRYPESGPAPSCDDTLRGFVRAGLQFAVAVKPTIRPKGKEFVRFVPVDTIVDPGMPQRITDKAIRGIFYRFSAQTRAKTARS